MKPPMCTVIGTPVVGFWIGELPPEVQTSPAIQTGTLTVPEPPKTVGLSGPLPFSQIWNGLKPPGVD